MFRVGLFFAIEDDKNPTGAIALNLSLSDCDVLDRSWPQLVMTVTNLAQAWMFCSNCKTALDRDTKAPELEHGINTCARTKSYWTRGVIVEWQQGLVVVFGDARVTLPIFTTKQAILLKNNLAELRRTLDWFLAANPKVIWTCRLTIGRSLEWFYKYFQDTIQPAIEANPLLGEIIHSADTAQGKVVQFVFDANLLATDDVLRQNVYNFMTEQMKSKPTNGITLTFTPSLAPARTPSYAPMPMGMQMSRATASST